MPTHSVHNALLKIQDFRWAQPEDRRSSPQARLRELNLSALDTRPDGLADTDGGRHGELG